MKIKVSEASGPVLDWLVASIEYPEDTGVLDPIWYSPGDYAFTGDWAAAGPIIERELITVRPVVHAERTESGSETHRQDGWAAHVELKAFWVTPRLFVGPTPLIAAMRCYVASELGDEVIVPDILMKQ